MMDQHQMFLKDRDLYFFPHSYLDHQKEHTEAVIKANI